MSASTTTLIFGASCRVLGSSACIGDVEPPCRRADRGRLWGVITRGAILHERRDSAPDFLRRVLLDEVAAGHRDLALISPRAAEFQRLADEQGAALAQMSSFGTALAASHAP